MTKAVQFIVGCLAHQVTALREPYLYDSSSAGFDSRDPLVQAVYRGDCLPGALTINPRVSGTSELREKKKNVSVLYPSMPLIGQG